MAVKTTAKHYYASMIWILQEVSLVASRWNAKGDIILDRNLKEAGVSLNEGSLYHYQHLTYLVLLSPTSPTKVMAALIPHATMVLKSNYTLFQLGTSNVYMTILLSRLWSLWREDFFLNSCFNPLCPIYKILTESNWVMYKTTFLTTSLVDNNETDQWVWLHSLVTCNHSLCSSIRHSHVTSFQWGHRSITDILMSWWDKEGRMKKMTNNVSRLYLFLPFFILYFLFVSAFPLSFISSSFFSLHCSAYIWCIIKQLDLQNLYRCISKGLAYFGFSYEQIKAQRREITCLMSASKLVTASRSSFKSLESVFSQYQAATAC